MMLLILGPDRGTTQDWSVRDLHSLKPPTASEPDEPMVMWPADYWPHVKALVEFDFERTRLGLPELRDAPME